MNNQENEGIDEHEWKNGMEQTQVEGMDTWNRVQYLRRSDYDG